MTAEHGGTPGAAGGGSGRDAGSGREYDGMDALMAAVTGEPLPEEARRDPAFVAEHRAAEADVAVLREQLAWLGEALAGEAEGEGEKRRAAVARPAGPVRLVPSVRSVRSVRPPYPGRRLARPARPGRRRARRLVLGSLAGAAAFALVAGFGWLVTHGSGTAGGASTASGARTTADPGRELACSRLVVEGTVARVTPEKASSRKRVALTVTRFYKPAHGPAEVAFLLDGGARPAPRAGQHVLVTVLAGEGSAHLWAVGDARVAVDRAWITASLPASRHLTCPSGEPPERDGSRTASGR